MPKSMDRAYVEHVLNTRLSLIPKELIAAFNDYQLKHYWRFLLIVNLLGYAAYLTYGFADAIVLPDIARTSFLSRIAFVVITMPVTLLLFRLSRNVQLLDLLLPYLVLIATVIWFELLSLSNSPRVLTYEYASLIFVVLANLCVQVRFLPSILSSLLIAVVTLRGVYHLNEGDSAAMLVFFLVYLPILFFSVFISWSTTLERRRAFLRAVIDDMSHQALLEANQKLLDIANTDSLTGVSNRRYFEEIGRREVVRAERHQRPLSLMILDVDFFKRINDTYGHPVGDKVLQALSLVARAELRENDLLARLGGEEFIVLLPDINLSEALCVAERLRLTFAVCNVPLENGEVVGFTVSIGVSQLGGEFDSLDTLLQSADLALYQAKNSGRNRVCSAANGVSNNVAVSEIG